MNPKEFVMGTAKEKAARATVQKFDGVTNLRPHDQRALVNARPVSRRLAIRQIGIGVGGSAAVVGGMVFAASRLSEIKAQPETAFWHDRLKLLRDKEVPPQLVGEIARDLAGQKEYPSLQVIGDLLLENQKNPDNIGALDPIVLPKGKPITMHLSNLGSTVALFKDRGRQEATAPITLKRKPTGETVTFQAVKGESSIIEVHLNNELIPANASPWLMRLMVAKEASHLLYIPELRQQMFEELRQRYDFPKDQELEDILFNTGLDQINPSIRVPALSPKFTQAAKNLDYAGFGHIALDLAKMRSKGLLTKKDQDILVYNTYGIDLAIKRGVIQKDPNQQHSFIWAPGMSPLSQEWLNIMEVTHQTRAGAI